MWLNFLIFIYMSLSCLAYVDEEHILLAIVEPRRHPVLSYVVNMALRKFTQSKLIIFHGRLNTALAHIISSEHGDRVGLEDLGVNDMKDVSYSYNSLLTSYFFWKRIRQHGNSSHVLIFQTDTAFCEASNLGLKKFLSYDYVGAPWSTTDKWVLTNNLRIPVGNGGFSLRNLDSMMEISFERAWDGETPEDIWFSKIMQENPQYGKVAPLEIALQFAVEKYLTRESVNRVEVPFGAHAPWRYLAGNDFQHLMMACPELLPLMRGSGGPTTDLSDAALSSVRREQDVNPVFKFPPVADCRVGMTVIRCVSAHYLDTDVPSIRLANKTALPFGRFAYVLMDALAPGSMDGNRTVHHYMSEDIRSFDSARLGYGCPDSNPYFPPSDTHPNRYPLYPPSHQHPLAANHVSLEEAGSVVLLVARGGCSFRNKVELALSLLSHRLAAVLVVYQQTDELSPPNLRVPTGSYSSSSSPPLTSISVPVAAVSAGEVQRALEDVLKDADGHPSGLLRAAVWLSNGLVDLMRGRRHLIDAAFNINFLFGKIEKLYLNLTRGDPFLANHSQSLHWLSRRLLRESCDIVIDDGADAQAVEGGEGRSLERLVQILPHLQPFTTIAVPQSLLLDFYELIVPKLASEIILITSDTFSDQSAPFPSNAPRELGLALCELLNHRFIGHWFSDNWNLWQPSQCPLDARLSGNLPAGCQIHPKLTLMPIGLSDSSDPMGPGDRILFTEAVWNSWRKHREAPMKKKRFAYANFHHSGESYDWMNPACSLQRECSSLDGSCASEDIVSDRNEELLLLNNTSYCGGSGSVFNGSGSRWEALRALVSKYEVHFDRPLRPELAWANRAEYMFEISPHGNGIDCHRTYEALALGMVPVVTTSPLDSLYRSVGFPVLILRDWSTMSAPLLETFWVLNLAQLLNALKKLEVLEKLTLEWWTNAINRKQIYLRERARNLSSGV